MRRAVCLLPAILSACAAGAGGAHAPGHALALAVEPPEAGRIEADPPAPSSGYAPGTPVSLRAVAEAGWGFDRWSGDAAGVLPAAQVVMDAPRQVGATFAKVERGDRKKPSVVFEPADQATCVATTRRVALRFSERMDAAATLAAVSVAPAIAGSWAWYDGVTRLELTPAAPLAEGAAYAVTIGSGARDFAGNALAPVSATFTTADARHVPASFGCLVSWMSGSFGNDRQYWEKLLDDDSRNDVRRIRLRMIRVWPDGAPSAAGVWLYVEQAVTYGDGRQHEQPPYRQRLYRLSALPDGAFESRIYGFRDRPVRLTRSELDGVRARLPGDDGAFLEADYEADGAEDALVLVATSRAHLQAVSVLAAVDPAVPVRTTSAALESLLAGITADTLARTSAASLGVNEARTLVRRMYVADPADAALVMLRSQIEVSHGARVRALFSAAGWNGGHNHDPLQYAGAWERPAPLADLGPDDFEEKTGCAVRLAWDGTRFVGGTTGTGCANAYGGASHATSEVEVGEGALVSWDRGFDSTGRQVWGGNERYVFDKNAHFPLQ